MTKIVDTFGNPITNIGALSTNYVGASKGRRSSVMTGRATGPNTAVDGELGTLRDRTRDATRNKPYNSKAINSLVNHEVGSGISCKFLVDDDEIAAELKELWNASLPKLVADGIGHFSAGQQLSSRGRIESGEVFIRKRRRSRRSDLKVPVQIQILESDFLDLDYNEVLNNGNEVRQGIELNSFGEEVAYWFFKYHPSDQNAIVRGLDKERVRIRARDVSHHFIPLRPGQRRGVPLSVAALFKSANLEKYDDFELERKGNHAAFTGTIEKQTPTYDAQGRLVDPITGQVYDSEEDIPNINLSAGMIQELLPGEKLNLFDAEKGGEFYADYMKQQLFAIAAAHNIPYELMTGDWSNLSNDRIARAVMNDFQRGIEAIQEIYLVTQICQATLTWWMDAAVLSGAINLPDYANRRDEYLKVDWRPQGWQYLHPVQDVEAAAARIEHGFSDHEKEARRFGNDADEVRAANIKYKKEKKELEEASGLTPEVEEEKEDTDE